MKRTHGQTTGHYTARVIDFALRYWFKIVVASCCLSVAYSAQVFTHRFLVFTSYMYETMELRGTLS